MTREDPTRTSATFGGQRAWWAMAVFIVASVVSFVDRMALSLLIDPIRIELRLTEVQMGLLQGSAFSLLYALAALPLGRIADSRSRRNLLLIGVSLWSAATALGGVAPNFEWLFASRVLVGIGEASLVPAALSMIADFHGPRGRGRAVSVFMMGQSLGGGVSIAFVGFILGLVSAGLLLNVPLLGALPAWRVVLVLCGLLGVVVVLLLVTVREPARTGVTLSATTPAARRRAALRYIIDRKAIFAPLYVGYAFMVLGSYGVAAWAPTMLMRRYALTASETGYLFGMVTAGCQFAGVLASGVLMSRLELSGGGTRKLAAAAAAGACCVPAILVGFAPSEGLALALLAFWFAFASMTGTLVVAANLDLYPSDLRGTATALSSLVNMLLGASLGPLLVAIATEKVFRDPNSVGLSISVVLAIALAVAVTLILTASRVLRRALPGDPELAAVVDVGSGTASPPTAMRSAKLPLLPGNGSTVSR